MCAGPRQCNGTSCVLIVLKIQLLLIHASQKVVALCFHKSNLDKRRNAESNFCKPSISPGYLSCL